MKKIQEISSSAQQLHSFSVLTYPSFTLLDCILFNVLWWPLKRLVSVCVCGGGGCGGFSKFLMDTFLETMYNSEGSFNLILYIYVCMKLIVHVRATGLVQWTLPSAVGASNCRFSDAHTLCNARVCCCDSQGIIPTVASFKSNCLTPTHACWLSSRLLKTWCTNQSELHKVCIHALRHSQTLQLPMNWLGIHWYWLSAAQLKRKVIISPLYYKLSTETTTLGDC